MLRYLSGKRKFLIYMRVSGITRGLSGVILGRKGLTIGLSGSGPITATSPGTGTPIPGRPCSSGRALPKVRIASAVHAPNLSVRADDAPLVVRPASGR